MRLLWRTKWTTFEAALHHVKEAALRTPCQVLSVNAVSHEQQWQALLPHWHGGTGLRHYDASGVAAARLVPTGWSDAVIAHGVES